MSLAHVQVILGSESMPPGIRDALQRVGATVSFEPISEVLRSGLKPNADAFVVIPQSDTPAGRDGLREVLSRVAHHPRATLVINPPGGKSTPQVNPAIAPVAYSDQSGAEELAARISTMIEMRPSLETLARKRDGIRAADDKLAQHYETQLRTAARVQREFLPRVLPRYGDFSFSCVYRPKEYVSGDVYDIRQLDEDHVAIAVADVQGHGIGAALMTVFVKRALAGETRRNRPPRPFSPDEVLSRLNDELLETNLSDPQFVTVVYALLDLKHRRVEIARGGAPYPIWRHANGSCELLAPPGHLIGILPQATYAVESIEMKSGDTLAFYTDGVEQLVLHQETGNESKGFPSQPPMSSNRTPPDRLITESEWYKGIIRNGMDAALEQINARHDMLRRLGRSMDDLTVLTLHCE